MPTSPIHRCRQPPPAWAPASMLWIGQYEELDPIPCSSGTWLLTQECHPPSQTKFLEEFFSYNNVTNFWLSFLGKAYRIARGMSVWERRSFARFGGNFLSGTVVWELFAQLGANPRNGNQFMLSYRKRPRENGTASNSTHSLWRPLSVSCDFCSLPLVTHSGAAASWRMHNQCLHLIAKCHWCQVLSFFRTLKNLAFCGQERKVCSCVTTKGVWMRHQGSLGLNWMEIPTWAILRVFPTFMLIFKNTEEAANMWSRVQSFDTRGRAQQPHESESPQGAKSLIHPGKPWAPAFPRMATWKRKAGVLCL